MENDNNYDKKIFLYFYGVSFQEFIIYYCYYKGIVVFVVVYFNVCIVCEQFFVCCGMSKGDVVS